MIRHQSHPDGEHWRVVFATNDPAGPFRLQRGSWVTGYGPDTGRVTRIFVAMLWNHRTRPPTPRMPPCRPVRSLTGSTPPSWSNRSGFPFDTPHGFD